jgi:hypothetical protein
MNELGRLFVSFFIEWKGWTPDSQKTLSRPPIFSFVPRRKYYYDEDGEGRSGYGIEVCKSYAAPHPISSLREALASTFSAQSQSCAWARTDSTYSSKREE